MTVTPRLILASSSPRRLALLQQIGRTPDVVIAADIDERAHKDETPRLLCIRLAAAKAAAIAAAYPGDIVIGADTVVALGRRVLPKAETDAEVSECLKLLSGRRHRVYGGICVMRGGRMWKRTVMTQVRFARLSDADRMSYVATKEGIGKAGGYAIQGHAAAFSESINGSFPNIVGLCLVTVSRLLDAAMAPTRP